MRTDFYILYSIPLKGLGLKKKNLLLFYIKAALFDQNCLIVIWFIITIKISSILIVKNVTYCCDGIAEFSTAIYASLQSHMIIQKLVWYAGSILNKHSSLLVLKTA